MSPRKLPADSTAEPRSAHRNSNSSILDASNAVQGQNNGIRRDDFSAHCSISSLAQESTYHRSEETANQSSTNRNHSILYCLDGFAGEIIVHLQTCARLAEVRLLVGDFAEPVCIEMPSSIYGSLVALNMRSTFILL